MEKAACGSAARRAGRRGDSQSWEMAGNAAMRISAGAARLRRVCAAAPRRSKAVVNSAPYAAAEPRQANTLGMALKQRPAGPGFQGLHLLGDGAGGDAEFLCRGGKALQARGRLEGAEGIERWPLGPGWGDRHYFD